MAAHGASNQADSRRGAAAAACWRNATYIFLGAGTDSRGDRGVHGGSERRHAAAVDVTGGARSVFAGHGGGSGDVRHSNARRETVGDPRNVLRLWVFERGGVPRQRLLPRGYSAGVRHHERAQHRVAGRRVAGPRGAQDTVRSRDAIERRRHSVDLSRDVRAILRRLVGKRREECRRRQARLLSRRPGCHVLHRGPRAAARRQPARDAGAVCVARFRQDRRTADGVRLDVGLRQLPHGVQHD
mmetsp:Transcript_54646/g.130160  ORF Transcript_54646/g.130160 Transcript_54646/m.130160 type:complete len:242 (-) Transcript_54646:199-924(-)